VIVKISLFEVPPPGAGFDTVTEDVPAKAISEERMVAVSDELETNVVARKLPFHRTVDEAMKFVPFTVRVKSPPPATVDVGLKEVVVGTGFPIIFSTVTVTGEEVALFSKLSVVDAVRVWLPSDPSVVFQETW
jgi:hypothetical protein